MRNRVRTNRKSTKGRIIYFQEVMEVVGTKKVSKIQHSPDGTMKTDKNGKKVRKIVDVNIMAPTGKRIKHVQETSNAISRKTARFNFFDKLEVLKSKWHDANPEYKKKVKV